MTDTKVLLVSPSEYEVIRLALLNLRVSNHSYVQSLKNKGGELRLVAEQRITTIDELLDKLVVQGARP